MPASVSVLIYTYNSENHIAECIKSAKLLTDNVVVVDQKSTDATQSIAKKERATIMTVAHHIYVEPIRMDGIKKATGDWIFILDADERMTKDLAVEIKTVIEKPEYTNYKVPRKNIFARQVWLKNGGWYPDEQTRLLKRSAIKDWPKKIHSTPLIEGKQSKLTEPMLHYFHGDLAGMVNKTGVFEQIESGLLYDANRASSTRIFFRKFLGELFRRLIQNAGWKDGMTGIIESYYQAYSKTITYLFLYEKQKA